MKNLSISILLFLFVGASNSMSQQNFYLGKGKHIKTLRYKKGRFIFYTSLDGFMSTVNRRLQDFGPNVDEKIKEEVKQLIAHFDSIKEQVDTVTLSSIRKNITKIYFSHLEYSLSSGHAVIYDRKESKLLDYTVRESKRHTSHSTWVYYYLTDEKKKLIFKHLDTLGKW